MIGTTVKADTPSPSTRLFSCPLNVFLPSPILTIPELRGIRVQGSGTTSRVEMNAKLIYVKENTCVRPVIESGFLEELIDQFCDLLRRVLMAVVANAL